MINTSTNRAKVMRYRRVYWTYAGIIDEITRSAKWFGIPQKGIKAIDKTLREIDDAIEELETLNDLIEQMREHEKKRKKRM